MRGRKLTIKYGITKEKAEALVDAGYALPAEIKKAKEKDLKAIVGTATAKILKGK